MSDCVTAALRFRLLVVSCIKPRMSRNFLGGFYQPRKPLPVFVREEIVDLYNNGVGLSEISICFFFDAHLWCQVSRTLL